MKQFHIIKIAHKTVITQIFWILQVLEDLNLFLLYNTYLINRCIIQWGSFWLNLHILANIHCIQILFNLFNCMEVGNMQQLWGNFTLQAGYFCWSELKLTLRLKKTRISVWTGSFAALMFSFKMTQSLCILDNLWLRKQIKYQVLPKRVENIKYFWNDFIMLFNFIGAILKLIVMLKKFKITVMALCLIIQKGFSLC